jgi:Tol biopolymer transport system component
MNIYSLTLAPPSVIQVTNIENKGTAATDRDHAMFSPDGEWIAFTALTTKTPHNLPCSALVNSDIFLINSNGSSTAVDITNTNGTSVEVLPRLGWQ